MTQHAQWISENAKQRRRLAALITPLSGEQLERLLPNGWTVAVALVHLAFWDLRQVTLLRRWMEEGVKPASLDAEAINEPLSHLSLALSPEASVALALDAAEAVDQAVEKLTDAQVNELVGMGLGKNLQRFSHRQNHLDKIEKALGQKA
jgi:DinB superfamily